MPRFPVELEFPHVIWLRFCHGRLRADEADKADYISPWCDVNNPSEGLLAEHDARVHIVRLYLIICAHCVLNASENDTEKT